MADAPNGKTKDDDFLSELEEGVRKILRNKKSAKADKLSAINAGVKIAAIRHKISGGEGDEGFFGK